MGILGTLASQHIFLFHRVYWVLSSALFLCVLVNSCGKAHHTKEEVEAWF